jgi:pyruvate/2-oxoglutarate dehydrogenase complex dihydrolipoamide dehydrogenase (E3) component
MKMGITADQLADMVHIHPALSEVLQRACGAIEW